VTSATPRNAHVAERVCSRGPPWWQWPTVLSLDAPLVSVMWQWAATRSADIEPMPAHGVVLGAVVWTAYAADRWLEGVRVAEERLATERHRFYRRHRGGVAAVAVGAAAVTVAIAATQLTQRDLVWGLLLLAAALTYLLSHQGAHRHSRWRVPKEVCVAALLTAGVVVFPLSARPVAFEAIGATGAWFLLLAFANCALISIWERDADTSQGQESLARSHPTWIPWLRTSPWFLAAVASFMTLAGRGGRFAGAAALSAVLLGVLDRVGPRLGAALARALADAALLAPLLALVVARSVG
jgi:hypothetical protein